MLPARPGGAARPPPGGPTILENRALTALAPLRGLVVIDEIQRSPELFPVLRVLADRRPLPARFLVLGSASPALLRQSSESLAGRIEVVPLQGFSLGDVGTDRHARHWVRGGFPRSFLARTEDDSRAWRQQFVRTYLERDLPQLGVTIPASTLHRFWTMVAHVHGGVWNAADPARSLGIAESTARRYLDLLSDLYLVRQLQPWHANVAKRQVKSPKVYVRDAGVLHSLLGIPDLRALQGHPKAGASFEGYAIEEALAALEPEDAWFWATHGGAELDLLVSRGGKRLGIEVKLSDAPSLTRSMRIAIEDLDLQRLLVVYPGERAYPLSERVHVLPIGQVTARGKSLWTRLP
ncbi:MAG: ATP-binding protein [Vicinamibacteria bacterium]|nr:ATP-binding protein [Vicinamibacteria bacterium]